MALSFSVGSNEKVYQCSPDVKVVVTENLDIPNSPQYTFIDFERWRLAYSDNGSIDISPINVHRTMIRVNKGALGVEYALLNEAGDIIGQISDFDQDGQPDRKVINDGKVIEVYVFIDNGWILSNNDENGRYVLDEERKKIYLKRDDKFGKYYKKQ
jgi:hypothetical protein